jgi:hypothetical protein
MQSKDQLFQHQVLLSLLLLCQYKSANTDARDAACQALIRLLQEQLHKEKEKDKEKEQEKEKEREKEKENENDRAGRGQMYRGEEAVVENEKQTSQQRDWEIERARFLAQIDDLTRKLHACELESTAHSAPEFEESESKVELKDEASLKAACTSSLGSEGSLKASYTCSLGPAEAEEAKQEEVSLKASYTSRVISSLGPAEAEEAKQEEVSLGSLGAFVVPPADSSILVRRKVAAHTATDAAVMRSVTQVIAQTRQRPVRWRVQIWRFAFEILGA